MKSIQYKKILTALIIASFSIACSDDDTTTYEQQLDFSGTYMQQDQMGRPAINTVFVSSANKDNFNTTTPSAMNSNFQAAFQSQLLALNSGYTTNLLNVSTTTTTTFYDGTNVLTGRALADDVIDVELILIFGGPNNADNPGLTSDHVDANDKAFLSSFPYLASPWCHRYSFFVKKTPLTKNLKL